MNNIAHFIWLGSELPFCYKLNIQTFKRQFKTKLHTEPLPNMVNIELFNRMKSYAGKADVLRLEILYQYGGLYSDCDSRLIGAFNFDHDLIVCRSPSRHIMNETMYVNKPKHPAFKEIVYGLNDHVTKLEETGLPVNIWDIAGASYIAPILRKYNIKELPYGVWGRKGKRTIISHSYDASWAKDNSKYVIRKSEKKPLNYWLW